MSVDAVLFFLNKKLGIPSQEDLGAKVSLQRLAKGVLQMDRCHFFQLVGIYDLANEGRKKS